MKRRTREILAGILTCVLLVAFMPSTPVAFADGRADGANMTISASYGMSMATQPDGSLYVWGWNGSGQLGIGGATYASGAFHRRPVRLMGDVMSVSGSTALRTDGSLYAWGYTWHERVGSGVAFSLTPVRIMENVADVSSRGHKMAIRTDGSLYAWGWNSSGQVGDGTTIDRNTPVRIMGDVVAVSAGMSHTMAIRTDGSLYAWGENWDGRLGDGTTEARLLPVRIMENVAAVSTGEVHTMAIRTDGSLYVWGRNTRGELGIGTESWESSPPTRIMENVTAISTNSGALMAIRADGSLYAWGENRAGRIDSGPTQSGGGAQYLDDVRNTPTRIMENVASVSVGPAHVLAIRTDGSLYAWGHNHYGVIGDGSPMPASSIPPSHPTPVRVMDNVMMPVATASVVPQPPAFQPPAVDQPSAWAAEQINAAIAAGLVPPVLQGSYTQATTRAEFAALAVALYETATGREIAIDRSIAFSDTTDVNVHKAATVGIVGGVGDNRFAPNDNLTREQAAVMLARLADVLNNPLSGAAPTFADNTSLSSWAWNEVGQMQVSGIMGGVGDNNFAPQGQYTREQSVVTIWRLFEMLS